ncbi:MAG: NAD(P)/FAD-dependent oxidoreductase [Gammaproteobacteria bacterium]
MRAQPEKPRVVIVGGGFGGLAAAKALANAAVEVTLIDKHNYHLFQPLLYQVATAALTPADIASPIRGILSGQKNATVYMDTVAKIEEREKQVLTENGRRLPYDYLILATGAEHSYFGKDHWEAYAPGLKNLDDATELRQRILIAFERAEMEHDPAKRAAYLRFVIVGGGPTGVEMAGAIAELAHSIAHDFRHVSTHCAQILLVEAGPRVLPQFSEALSERAKRDLQAMGVDVRVNTRVEDVGRGLAILNGSRLEAETLIWAAGVKASPAGQWLNAATDRAGRVLVNPDLSVPEHPDVFVIGDAAAFTPPGSERALPGLAPVAKQQGHFVGAQIAAKIRRDSPPAVFRYRNYGTMATIGRNRGIADLVRLRFTGIIGWLLWGVVHIYFLIGFGNRLMVALRWFWAYLAYQRGVRLITGIDEKAEEEEHDKDQIRGSSAPGRARLERVG